MVQVSVLLRSLDEQTSVTHQNASMRILGYLWPLQSCPWNPAQIGLSPAWQHLLECIVAQNGFQQSNASRNQPEIRGDFSPHVEGHKSGTAVIH